MVNSQNNSGFKQDFNKIICIINSCETLPQISCAEKCVDLLYIKYKDLVSLNHLHTLYKNLRQAIITQNTKIYVCKTSQQY